MQRVNVAVEEFKSHLEQREGFNFEDLTVFNWVRRVRLLGLSDFVASYIDDLCRKGAKSGSFTDIGVE